MLIKRNIRIYLLMSNLKKKDIIQIGLNNGVDFSHTSSCYDPNDQEACGKCDACLLRLKGFDEAKANDPLWRT